MTDTAHDRGSTREKRRTGRVAAILVALAALILAALLARASEAPAASASATYTLIAKAQPDECFAGIGVAYPPGPPCPGGSTPKVNGAYLWSMVEPPGAVWFGTAANVVCAAIAESSTTTPTPTQSSDNVCEYASSTYNTGCFPKFRDVRPPHIYRYDIASNAVVDKTPTSDSRLRSVQGIRMSTRNGGVLLFGGPDCARFNVDLFAFNESTGAYLGSTSLGYSDVRRAVVVGGVLYIGAKTTRGGGAILRWTGNLKRPFQFTQVGTLDSEAAEVAEYQGRIVVGTWPFAPTYGSGSGVHAGLWLSPSIPAGGLTAANAGQWTKVWSVDAYEPDTVTAASYGIGMMASYGGYLYFGTMHQSGSSRQVHENAYGPDTTDPPFRSTGTRRASAYFRAKNLGAGNQQVDLLYGQTQLWVESPANTWTLVNNNMNTAPLFGTAGFGNTKNTYDWSMAVFNNQLYVGTLDTGGADLWAFPDTNSAAVAVTQDGFGNPSNYGVRSMLADAGGIWIGTASGSNLLTDPSNPPLGGWEFGRLTTP